MTVDDIKAYGQKYSKAYNNGPWQTEFDAMAKKTVIRQILKYGPMSTEMQEAETMEIKAAEEAAHAEIVANANAGEVIDVTYVPDADPETGEVIESGAGAALPETSQPDF